MRTNAKRTSDFLFLSMTRLAVSFAVRMRTSRVWGRTNAAGVLLLAMLTGRSYAAEIVIVGDSWGDLIATHLTEVAEAQGFSVDDIATFGLRAMTLAANANQIEDALSNNPDARVVHLSVGGNDFLRRWSAAQTLETRQRILGDINEDVETIISHIGALRPDLEIFHVSYDFIRPLDIGAPEEVNNALLSLAQLHEGIEADNYEYLNFYGLTQLEFGLPELGIPPGHASLPRTDQPGPQEAFADAIHLTGEGYRKLAERSFEAYHGVLVPEPASLIVLLAGLLGGLSVARSPRGG